MVMLPIKFITHKTITILLLFYSSCSKLVVIIHNCDDLNSKENSKESSSFIIINWTQVYLSITLSPLTRYRSQINVSSSWQFQMHNLHTHLLQPLLLTMHHLLGLQRHKNGTEREFSTTYTIYQRKINVRTHSSITFCAYFIYCCSTASAASSYDFTLRGDGYQLDLLFINL